MRRLVLPTVLALALVIAGQTGLRPAAAGEPSAAPTVTLRVGWTVGPDNLSPFIGYETSSYEVWSLQYDSLFLLYPDGTFGPGLAAEIPTEGNGGISAGGRVWTVKLRSGVTWSDGKPLTAEDVAFTYNRVAGDRTSVLYSAVRGIERVEVVDPVTVRIRCDRPKADMLAQTLPILPRHVWGRVSPAAANSSHQNRPPIVGSGPFAVTEFKKGVYVKMERNPHYWGKRPALDEVVFLTYSDGETMTQDLKLGVIDAALGLPPALFRTLRDDPRLRTVARNLLEFEAVFFNCKDGPSRGNPALRDRAFRRALATAIDRDRLASVVHSGLASAGTTILQPATWADPDWHWQPPADGFAFDLQKARRELEAAGYRDTDGDGIREDHSGMPIRLRVWPRADSISTQGEGKLIAGWWKDIGIDVDLAVMDIGAIDDRFWNREDGVYVPDFDVTIDRLLNWVDPGQTLDQWKSYQVGLWNMAAWSDPAYDRLWDEQSEAVDPERRKAIVWRMQELLYEEAVNPVLVYPDALQAYDRRDWDGWAPLPLAGRGTAPVIGTGYNVETYLNLRPTGREAEGGGAPASLWVAAGATLAGAGATWYVLRRRARRAPAEEEA
jgi:peptide/nickel transport system substrate-binding protein